MKSIILCEGKMDMILLSYYLGKAKNWTHLKNPKKHGLIHIPTEYDNEAANWYACEDRRLVIWAVGGQSRFGDAIGEVMTINHKEDADRGFSKIVILADRDQNAADDPILTNFQSSFFDKNVQIKLKNHAWSTASYETGFGEAATLQVMPLIIPFEKKGALETFLLDALAEKEAEKPIVDAARSYVKGIESPSYLPNDRLRLKAELASTFAVINPEGVFTLQHDLLTTIPWESYRTVQATFQLLDSL